jgi:hypothetical protein
MDYYKEMCKGVTKREGFQLQYVENQTDAMCMYTVQQNGLALRHVKHQTEAICLEAVRETGLALKDVINQTEAICLAALKRNRGALEYVKDQTDFICLYALLDCDDDIWWKSFGYTYNRIKYPSPQLVNQLLKLYPSHTDIIMTNYVIGLMKNYGMSSNAVSNIVQHTNDLLYRPNNVVALVSQVRWHMVPVAKSLFLMA